MEDNNFFAYSLENVINITKIVSIHYFDFSKDYIFEGEAHNFWEFVYVEKGKVIVNSGNGDEILEQDDIIFHKPNEYHCIRANGKDTAKIFVIAFISNSTNMRFFYRKKMKVSQNLKKFIKYVFEESRFAFKIPNEMHYCHLLKRKDSPFGAQQLLRTYLEQLLILLIREETKPKEYFCFSKETAVFDAYLVETIMDLIQKNIYGQLNIDTVCQQTNYGKTHISNTFKNATGYSVMQYYCMQKIEESKRLIRKDQYSFSQIANMLNFNNPLYFSRTFKRIVGMSPSEFHDSMVTEVSDNLPKEIFQAEKRS